MYTTDLPLDLRQKHWDLTVGCYRALLAKTVDPMDMGYVDADTPTADERRAERALDLADALFDRYYPEYKS